MAAARTKDVRDARSTMRRWILLLTFACCAATAVAQPAAPSSRIPTVTRLVKLFSELEASLVNKAHEPGTTALDALLDPAFEIRAAGQPGTPIPRDEAIRELRASPRNGRIDQMAVHDLGDVALVSFREVAARSKNNRFIVDCWKRDGADWKLLVRYASGATSVAASRLPGGTIEKRY